MYIILAIHLPKTYVNFTSTMFHSGCGPFFFGGVKDIGFLTVFDRGPSKKPSSAPPLDSNPWQHIVRRKPSRFGSHPPTTWMCEEDSKWLVNGLYPQYNLFISRLYPIYQPFTNFLGHPRKGQQFLSWRFGGGEVTHVERPSGLGGQVGSRGPQSRESGPNKAINGTLQVKSPTIKIMQDKFWMIKIPYFKQTLVLMGLVKFPYRFKHDGMGDFQASKRHFWLPVRKSPWTTWVS